MEKMALLLIDIQNVYFEEGPARLHEPESAAHQAKTLLQFFRSHSLLVIHMKHLFSSLGQDRIAREHLLEFYRDVTPAESELVMEKEAPNAFFKTNLQNVLKDQAVTHLVVAGMMSHMCVDTTVRAARDYGLHTTVVHDACAAAELHFQGSRYDAATVHNVFMAGLADGFASVVSCEEFLNGPVL